VRGPGALSRPGSLSFLQEWAKQIEEEEENEDAEDYPPSAPVAHFTFLGGPVRPGEVAQNFDLLYRRFAIGSRPCGSEFRTGAESSIGRSAG
jgi:hypothetical protein